LFARALRGQGRVGAGRAAGGGAGLLFGALGALLVALSAATASPWPWALAPVALLAAFVYVERRVDEPILPLDLLTSPIISRSMIVVFMLGVAVFGAIAFVPLFVQVVMGGTATQARQALAPLFLAWGLTSALGARPAGRA